MKYSGIIGTVAVAILIYSCTMVWITLPSLNITISGFHSEGLRKGSINFGRPGLMITFLGGIAAMFFLIPRLWAKRANVFVCALILAWTVANYYRIGVICRAGDCPERHTGIYIMLFAGIIIFVMSLLPRLEMKK